MFKWLLRPLLIRTTSKLWLSYLSRSEINIKPIVSGGRQGATEGQKNAESFGLINPIFFINPF